MNSPAPAFEPPRQFNIADYFLDARIREGLGGKVALRVDRGEAPPEELTYAEVQALANRFAQVLSNLGIEPEQRVVISLPDGAEFAAALFGVLKLGAVVVMVNPGFGADELTNLYDYIRPQAVIVDGDAADACLEAASRLTWPKTVLTVGAAIDGHPSFETRAASVSDDFENVATDRDDPAIWLFSGGTTGRPKAVVQSHRSFANTTELYAKGALGYRAEDVTLSVPKLYFGYATGSNLLFPFAVGATAVLFSAKPTPDEVFAQIRRHRPSILVNVPTLVNQMVQHPEAASHELACLRFATSAGEALPVPLYHRWKELFGVELLDGLGTAEMWHIFVTNRPGAVKPGTLGQVVEGFEVQVRDDADRPVATGEVGRLWVRGDSRAICYWREQKKSEEGLRGPWFVGGDLVSVDAEGFVTYHGRGDDVLKVGGKWLVPGEVESCLMQHEAVKECAVVGVTDADGLTKPHAFVVCRRHVEKADDALAAELKRHVIECLEPYKHPREVTFLEDLPRTHLGKVDRGKLKGGS